MKNSIKKILKKIPFFVKLNGIIHKDKLYSQNEMTEMIFEYYKERFYKNAAAYKNSKIKEISYITWLYHVIEKGLAMPDMKLGFGHQKIVELVECILLYRNNYGVDNRLLDAVSVILEYKRVHSNSNFSLYPDVEKAITLIKKEFPNEKPINQMKTTKRKLFSNINSPFPEFIRTRHSIRNFSTEPLEIKQIIDSVELARFAPSACNRQHSRVHIINNKETITECLKMQSGNRGFGDLADKLLIITGDLGTILGAQEFLDLNTNVGIFIMNLSYALHYNKVAHCILNWYALPKQDIKLRKYVGIPDSETVVAFILCGNAPENEFKVVSSPRVDAKQIYTIH